MSIRSQLKSFLEPISLKITITCLIWYFVSSTTSQLTKDILNEFPFPIAVGQIQFFLAASLCSLLSVLVSINHNLRDVFPRGTVPLTNDVRNSIIISKKIFKTTLPMGMFQFIGKYFSLAATSLVPIASVSSIKALSPLLIVSGYRFYYGVKFPFVTYLSLAPLVAGVVFIVIYDSKNDALLSGEINKDHIKGISFAALSAIVFATQNIYAKRVVSYNISNQTDPASLAINTKSLDLLPTTNMDLDLDRVGDKEKELMKRESISEYTYSIGSSSTSSTISSPIQPMAKIDKVTILMYCSTLGFCFSLPAFILNDLPKLLNKDLEISPPYFLLLLNGISHFLQALLAFHLLGTTPTLTYSIASMLKRIVIITMSMIWVGNSISGTQWLGLSLIGFGLYCYDRWGSKNL